MKNIKNKDKVKFLKLYRNEYINLCQLEAYVKVAIYALDENRSQLTRNAIKKNLIDSVKKFGKLLDKKRELD
jgi:hypothetical protein